MINFKTIGQRIKFFRKKNSLTQEQLAEALDISTEHLSRIETGSYRPSISLIENLCVIFKIDEEELMFGTKTESALNLEIYKKIDELSDEKKQAILTIIDLIK